MGWDRNTTRLTRALGMDAYTETKDGVRRRSFSQTIALERAVGICEALRVDFDELYEGKLPPVVPRGGKCKTCEEVLLMPSDDGLCGFCTEERVAFSGWAVAS
jgi:hypothetical protein